jgi:hypothetical protein
MIEKSRIIYRKGREVLADTVYVLTLPELERLCRDYMDATLRGIVNDPETSNKFLNAKIDQIIG